MDYAAVVTNSRFEDVDVDRKRLDAFKLGGGIPPPGPTHRAHKPSHSRSHSRHTSSVSVPLSVSPVSPLPPVSSSSPSSSPPPTATGSKRNSHHRRRSSVSTRRESAEIMGVTLPTLAPAPQEDNLTLGDKDSIRRRALLALEGRTEVGAFSRVQIPELSSPESEKRFEFPSKPSYPPGIGAGYGGGLSSISSNKRDSFGKFMSMSSSKDILGTLVEEEEEEEHTNNDDDTVQLSASVSTPDAETVASPVEGTATLPSPVPTRPRPPILKLRPLSLSPNLIQVTNGELPTPAATPVPRPGLKSLTLSPSLGCDSSNASVGTAAPSRANRRQSMFVSGSSFPAVPTRRSSLNGTMDATTGPPQPTRRTSISYFGSEDKALINNYGLPTPEMTPISDRRYSQDSSSSGSRSSRSLSVSEQHFLYQAHNALVQRISDLERALSARPRSRPQSCASDVSAQSDAPGDEMFQLIADLKSERDELKKDVDGWRTRVADFEHQVALLMKRVETERREAWVARERMNMMEFEKKAVEASLAEKIIWGEEGWKKSQVAQDALSKAEEECRRLRTRADRVPDLELEISRLAAAFGEEKKKREDTEKELESVLNTPTPQAFELSQYRTPPVSRTMVFAKRGGLGFRSVDSTASSTDVESLDGSFDRHQLCLKVVHEENEDDGHEDELACYEDEDENDKYVFQASMSDCSFGSDADEPRDTSHLTGMTADADYLSEMSSSASGSLPTTPAPPSPPQRHDRHVSLIKAWTFPQGSAPVLEHIRDAEEVDHFFGCLEDVDNSPPLDSKLRSAESEKNLFARALANEEDDFPFMIPSDVGVEVPVSNTKFTLDAIAEDEEEEESTTEEGFDEEIVGQEVEGGIIFTFTPPSCCEEPEVIEAQTTSSMIEEPRLATKAVISSQTSLVSSIPRSSSSKSFASNIPVHSASTPVKCMTTRIPRASESPSAAFTPTKRVVSPSSIPRLSQSPTSPSIPSPSPKARSSSFIPQPRKPLASMQPGSVTTPTKAPAKSRMSMFRSSEHVESATLQMRNAAPTRQDSSEAPEASAGLTILPFTSPTFSAIQTLTSFMPSLPWSSPKIGSPMSNPTSSSSTASSLASSASDGDLRSVVLSAVGCSSAPAGPKTRGYVPRERQLARLKLRLDHEGRSKSIGYTCGSPAPRKRFYGDIVDL